MAAQRPENINEIILDTAEELLKVNSFSEVMSLFLVSHFNSIKVRLEPKGDNNSVICMLFQFHKGTIRTSIYYNATTHKVISIP